MWRNALSEDMLVFAHHIADSIQYHIPVSYERMVKIIEIIISYIRNYEQ